MTRLTRRNFMVGCSAAIAALAGSRITDLAFAAPDAQANPGGTLVTIFLRGGWDGLSVMPVVDGPDRGYYEAERANIKLPASALLRLGTTQFGFHPALAPLLDLYTANRLAVIAACGLVHDTRSHFDAMSYMELGTPGVKSTTSGWIGRHLRTAPYSLSSAVFPALSTGGSLPQSMFGYYDVNRVIAMSRPGDFDLPGWEGYTDKQRAILAGFYAGATFVDDVGAETLRTIQTIQGQASGDYVPANGAVYPDNDFADNLKVIAQMIKGGFGLNCATVDLGGWDTHENQAQWNDPLRGQFADLLGTVAQSLKAFYQDLDGGSGGWVGKTTTIVMSEFGRRLRENPNRGTDHGHGSLMLVMGGGIAGGQIYGRWPGLQTDQLYDQADLQITTDYRQVVAEVVNARLGNPRVGAIFPGFTPAGTPIGLAGSLAAWDMSAAPPDSQTLPPLPPPPNLTRRIYIPSIRR